MTTKSTSHMSDFAKALEIILEKDLAYMTEVNGKDVPVILCDRHKNAIEQALRESHALRQEPSEEMMDALHEKLSGDPEGYCSTQLEWYKDMWKAMRDQLIKDVENE